MSFGSRQALLRGFRRLGLTGLDLTMEPRSSQRGVKANGSGFRVRGSALRLGVKVSGSGFPVLGSALRSGGIESGVEGTGVPAKSQGKADEPSALRASRLLGAWSW